MAAKRPLQIIFNRIYRGNSCRSFGALSENTMTSSSSQNLIDLEYQRSAHNYHPIPVVFSKAKGSSIWDPEGNKYLDFLSAYSAVNQGHCHPKVLKALTEQAERLTLSSRAFYNDRFPLFADHLTSMFGYEMVLPMNTGAEGVETALKLARKWGYEKKKIPKDEAIIVSCCGCFHGRTLAVISMSCDNEATRGFGPLLPGHLKVDFGDEVALEKIFKVHGDQIAGFLFEPIQGEAGVIIPPEGYLKAVRDLCSKYNILMIADEIQTGLARTGRMLACDWEEVRPDVVVRPLILFDYSRKGIRWRSDTCQCSASRQRCYALHSAGRAWKAGNGCCLSRALYSNAVPPELCSEVYLGESSTSTFGGNPLASAVAVASLDVIREEGLAERSAQMGQELRQLLIKVQQQFPNVIKEVRGKGLFNAVELNSQTLSSVSAYDICIKLKERGVLAKPTHDTIIRLTPPLCMSLNELEEGAKVLHDVLKLDVPKMQKEKPETVSQPATNACDHCGRTL
ncbi:hypothetical protein RHGRI_036780 [Rhododendron griersonianum]|uniref:ornithine aminotransferase n=1 Tax=Rhododendron griersonianum TaxID=479676 RepID=A0AAV6HT34_9ERIC|nr:hypothetical protein RHGRI_036780 [Rhododendron griersonianum]